MRFALLELKVRKLEENFFPRNDCDVQGCNGDDCAASRDAARHEDSSAAGARQGPWLCLDPGGALGKHQEERYLKY